MLGKALYHIINIEPNAYRVLEAISDGGSWGRVPLEACSLSRYLSAGRAIGYITYQFNSIQFNIRLFAQRVSLEGGLVAIKIAIPSSKLTPLLPDSNKSRKVRQKRLKSRKEIYRPGKATPSSNYRTHPYTSTSV